MDHDVVNFHEFGNRNKISGAACHRSLTPVGVVRPLLPLNVYVIQNLRYFESKTRCGAAQKSHIIWLKMAGYDIGRRILKLNVASSSGAHELKVEDR